MQIDPKRETVERERWRNAQKKRRLSSLFLFSGWAQRQVELRTRNRNVTNKSIGIDRLGSVPGLTAQQDGRTSGGPKLVSCGGQC